MTNTPNLKRRSLLRAPLAAAALAAAPGLAFAARYHFRLPVPNVRPESAANKVATCPKMLTPAYFWTPEEAWAALATESNVGSELIFNPNSGPRAVDGTEPAYTDPANHWPRIFFDPKLAACRTRNTIYGYLRMEYGARPLAEALLDVDIYRQHWGVTHYFIDETETAAGSVATYTELYNQIQARSPGALVILNPGMLTDDLLAYFNIGPNIRIVTFEQSAANWDNRYRAEWHKAYRNRSYALVHGCSYEDAQRIAHEAGEEGYLGFYCTDLPLLPNPWQALASYWKELQAVCR